MTDLRKIQLIEKSHFNQLSKKERQELEQYQAQNSDFAKEAVETEALLQGFGALALEDFEGQVNEWEQKHRNTQQAKVRKMSMAGNVGKSGGTLGRLLRVAAVVLVLLLPVAYFVSSGGFDSSSSNEALFQAYYADGPQFMDFRVRGDDSKKSELQRELENRKRKGLALFNNGNYKMATHNLNIYVENSEKRDYEAIISLATAQLAQKEINKAIPLYQLVIEAEEPAALSYQDQAAWLLALAQLRNNEVPAAKLQLKELAKDEYSDYQEQATQLLQALQERE